MEQMSHNARENGQPTTTNLLQQLDTYKSMGPNGIHTWILRELAKMLSELVSIVYQQSCLTRQVSIVWSLANIIPI